LGCSSEKPPVGELFGFEQGQRIGAAAVAQASQLGITCRASSTSKNWIAYWVGSGAAAPFRDDERVVAPAPQKPSRQHQVGHLLGGIQGRLVAVCARTPQARAGIGDSWNDELLAWSR
jgi:hypothetical protein